MKNSPADTGTACHFALEKFVIAVYIDEVIEWDNVEYLKAQYELGYMQTFNSGDFSTPEFKDGAQMVANWYETYKHGLFARVLSCEVKESFPIQTSIGEIPFNYIWDRSDEIIEGEEYEVIDYKTFRMPVQPEELRLKVQARAYGVAAQVKWPHAKRIKVTFDLLRYGPVSVYFTREDNIESYRMLQREAERIIAADPDLIEPQINPDCKWCVVKTNCPALLHIQGLNTALTMSAEELAAKQLEISSALEALKYAKEQVDLMLMKEAENRNEFEFTEGDYEVALKSRPRRQVNSSSVAHIVGPELSAQYGNFTMGNIDIMLKSGVLDEETTAKVKAEITKVWSEPTPKVKKIS